MAKTLKELHSDLKNINKELNNLGTMKVADEATIKFLDRMSTSLGLAIAEAKNLESQLKLVNRIAKESGTTSSVASASSRILDDIKKGLTTQQANLEKYLTQAIGGVKLGGAGGGGVEKLSVKTIKDYIASLQEMQKNLASDTQAQTLLGKAAQEVTNQINNQTAAVEKRINRGQFQKGYDPRRYGAKPPADIVTSPNQGIPTGDARVLRDPLPPNTLNADAQAAENFAFSVKNVRESLEKLGVTGEAANRILATLEAQMRAMPGGITTGIRGTSAAGTLNLKALTVPPDVKATSAETKVGEKYDVQTGELASIVKARKIAQDKIIAELKQNQIKFAEEWKRAWELRGKGYEQAVRENEHFDFVRNAQKDPTLKPIFTQAQQRGFSENDIKSIERQGTAGTRLVSFAKDDFTQGYKIVQKFNATITQTGDVLPEVGRRFRTFGASVVRDIGELTKWSIAMAVIYGPIQKLSEITSLMIQNEVKLASATIAVNNAFTSSQQIFNASADAANRAGEEINTTIDAFTQAYRATGGGADESTRFATAQTLLADSMTLAKIAGIDESTAIDTLSAALRQTGKGLGEGSSLLDKWVKTSQVANVDIATLATGFAVMGDTAEAAGLNVDQLNALVATVAETGLASGKEAANSARRLVTAYQTPGAIEALRKLGIATEDYTGKARGFLDISKEIYEMKQKGLISKEDFSNLTLVAGQGVRGQAALSAVISNFNRVGQITAVSESTQGGEAAKAMEKQLTTAQTAINRFNNSFQSLAQTMGTKGGLLDLFKNITNGATVFIKVLDGITSGLGKATPMVIALTAALVAYYRKPAETRAMYGSAIENSITGFVNRRLGTGTYGVTGGLIGPGLQNQPLSRGEQVSGAITSASRGGLGWGQAGLGAGLGIATGAVTALGNLASGDTEKAAYDMGGAIAGGILGSFVGGPMGAVIGSTIGTSMAEVFLSLSKPEIDLWKIGNIEKTVNGTSATTGTKNTRETELKGLAEKLVTGVGGTQVSTETFLTNQAIESINKRIAEGDTEKLKRLFAGLDVKTSGILSSQGINLETATSRTKTGVGFQTLDPGQIAYALSKDTGLKSQFDALKNAAVSAGDTGESTATKKKVEADLKYSGAIEKITTAALQDLAAQSKQGKIKPVEYANQATMAGNADTILQPVIAALGGEVSPEKLQELFNIMTYGATEATQPITTLAENILSLYDSIAAITDDPAKKKELEDQLKLLRGQLQGQVEQQAVQVSLNRTPQAQIQGDVANPFTQQAVTSIVAQTRNLQRNFYRSEAGGGLSDRQISTLETTFEKAAFPIQQGAELFYQTVEGLDPKFIPIAEKFLEAAGMQLQASQQQKSVDFQQFKDVDRATLESAAKQSIALNQQWKTKFGYTGTVEQQIAIAKNGVASPLKADFKILAMLLEKLVDQGQKQLDGMFNIPEGSSFWVNLAAAKMDRETRKEKIDAKDLGITTGEGPYIGSGTTGKPVQEPPQLSVADTLKTTYLDLMDKKMARLDAMEEKNFNPWTNTSTDAIEALRAKNITESKDAATTGMEQLLESLRTLFSGGTGGKPFEPTNPMGINPGVNGVPGLNTDLPSILKEALSSVSIPPQKIDNTITQNLNVRMTSTTNLVVDGRILATIVKQYLASDMSKATSTNSTSSAYFAV